jgi:hypothetical protein
MMILMSSGLKPSLRIDSTIIGPDVGMPVEENVPLGCGEQPRTQTHRANKIERPNNLYGFSWLIPFQYLSCEGEEKVVVFSEVFLGQIWRQSLGTDLRLYAKKHRQ